jgi:hypothetical protein
MSAFGQLPKFGLSMSAGPPAVHFLARAWLISGRPFCPPRFGWPMVWQGMAGASSKRAQKALIPQRQKLSLF